MYFCMGDENRQIEIKDLTAGELAAIAKHHDEMVAKLHRNVTLQEAIEDFLVNCRLVWEREKLLKENEEQMREIERHKWIESEKAGYDIGEHRAVEDWMQKCAHIWRAERESLEKNGWEVLRVRVGIEKGLHMRPTSTLAGIAGRFKCQVYVNRPGMGVYNFFVNGKPYLNVKSVMGLLTLGAVKGDELEFIATGVESREALAAIGEYVGMNVDDVK